MNYADLIKSISPQVLSAIKLINNPEIAPEVRLLNQEILLKEVGQAIYEKVYDMNAYDFEIQYTKGKGLDDRYLGLAKKASGSISTGSKGLEEYINNYLVSSASLAQKDAYKNAKQTKKFPKVTRTESSDACKWCRSKVGSYSDPSSDVFARHGGCEGKIVTEGYKSRNGLLGNYKEPVKTKFYRTEGNTIGSGGDLFGEGYYVYRNKNQIPKGLKADTPVINIAPNQIYTIKNDAQYEALIRDAQRSYPTLDTQKSIPKLMQKRGFKAVEGTPEYDPLAGMVVYDPKLIVKK